MEEEIVEITEIEEGIIETIGIEKRSFNTTLINPFSKDARSIRNGLLRALSALLVERQNPNAMRRSVR